jgi:integrase
MASDKLNADSVERLPYRQSPALWSTYWHHKLAGFGLRITSSGARSYVVRYRLRGSRAQRMRTLGPITVLKFGEAMDRARVVLREAEAGRDWFDMVARERAQTMGQVWKYYTSEHLSAPDISQRTREDAKLLWTNHCAQEFEFCALADVSSERARDWHRRRTRDGGPYVANRAVQALRAAWNFGVKYGRIPRDHANPFASITLNKERARQTILEPHRFPAFAKAVNNLGDPFARAYVWMLFYTGCRRTELLKLHWDDVEIQSAKKDEPRSGSITLRATKGGEPRVVALSAPAVEILEALPRTDNQHVFIGALPGTHLDPNPHWRDARKAAGLPELRMHDLRRSFGSWLGASGWTPKLIGAALGHRTDVTSRVYVQLGAAAGIKRQLVAAHAALAAEFAKEKPMAEVVPLKRSGK